MELKSSKLIYFSPTGTSKKIAHAIAQGVDNEKITVCDITKPSARESTIDTTEDELLIVAIPVYMARVPALISNFLGNLNTNKTPTVGVILYGNRLYGNALLELRNILSAAGCIVVGCGAFIGEHSFSSHEFPIAQSRPDFNDIECAINFGKTIKEKLKTMSSLSEISELTIPGHYPYGGVTELWSVDFIAVSDKCNQNGRCAEVCPTGAVNQQNTKMIDIQKCISCCACIKSCPERARTIKESQVKEAAIRLNSLFREPKMPEIFY